jgi:CrcB protein
MNIILIGIGGFIGSVMRYLIGLCFANSVITTLIINVFGSFAIGIFFHANIDLKIKQFLMIGICGGFTTFSSFSLQAYQMILSGNISNAILYSLISVFLCIIAIYLGFKFFNLL